MDDLHTIGLTDEQIERWKRGELCIEFQIDSPPEVNPQDFEKWIRRGIKPKTYQVDDGWRHPDTFVIYDGGEIKPL